MRRCFPVPVAPPVAQRYGESPLEPEHGHNRVDTAASASMSGPARASFQRPAPQSDQAKYQLHIATLVEDSFVGNHGKWFTIISDWIFAEQNSSWRICQKRRSRSPRAIPILPQSPHFQTSLRDNEHLLQQCGDGKIIKWLVASRNIRG